MTDDSYTVRSLYFDTPSDTDLFSAISGVMQKSKIRLRVYPPNLNDVKLELKQKTGQLGIKTSLDINKTEAKNMMKSQYSFLLSCNDDKAKKIYMHLASNSYIPKVITEYKRCAYKYSVSNTRITFDYDIKACIAGHTFFNEEIIGNRILERDMGVLEVKYDNFLINGIKDIIRDIDELNIANSKYVNSRLLFL